MKELWKLEDFKIIESLGESMHAKVFKVSRRDDNEKVFVLKQIKPTFTGGDSIQLLYDRYVSMESLEIRGMIKPTFHRDDKGAVFFTQDFYPGKTLAQWLNENGPISLSDFFKISKSLTEILTDLHAAGFYHGAIKPSNILIQPQSLNLRLIDPVRIYKINELSLHVKDEDFCLNTLPYISPEQTGRIRQTTTFETDFYSLGVLFQELLTGVNPFVSTDPLEIIHSHLAFTPMQAHEINSTIPEVLADVVTKLMVKEPEKRYRSGDGLIHDLNYCQENFEKNGYIIPFTLGHMDFTEKITLPSIMVGRDNERRRLLDECQRTHRGEFRTVLISGLPGIGKTRLIQEIEVPIITNKGYFISGKFDQYQKNVPYGTLIQAFRNFIRIILTEDEKRVEAWKKRIIDAIGVNGGLLTNLLPELSLIIGKPPEVASVPPMDAKRRFTMVMGNFIASLASLGTPLTLFIDDLQWCDAATFDVIKNILKNPKGYPYLFLLGAYRHNEVDQYHPLTQILDEARQTGFEVTEIRLEELKIENIKKMIAYIINDKEDNIHNLANIINTTAMGNPLFVNEAISWMHSNQMIKRTNKGKWTWDENQLFDAKIPISPAALFADKIKLLPEKVLEILRIMSCLGSGINLDVLCIVLKSERSAILKTLSLALENRLLVERNGMLSFFHDRVQEAVYSTLDKKQSANIHKDIAEILLDSIPKGVQYESVDNLLTIVDHLNAARNEHQNNDDRRRDVELNYYAGKKATDSLALNAANRYFNTSWALKDEDIWEKNYKFTYALSKSLAASELSLGNQKKANILLNKLIKKVNTDLDRADCLTEQTVNLLSLSEATESIRTANQALTYFGKALPDDEALINKKIIDVSTAIEKLNYPLEDIFKKQPLTNRQQTIELTLYNQLIPAYYMTGQLQLLSLTSLQAVDICLRTGLSHLFIYPFGLYSVFLTENEQYDEGFKWTDLVLKLCEKFSDTVSASRGLNSLTWLNLVWQHKLDDIRYYSQKSIETSRMFGDSHNAGLGYAANFWSLAIQGNNLKEVDRIVKECIDYSHEYNAPLSIALGKGMDAAWVKPMAGKRVNSLIDADITGWRKMNNLTLLCSYYVFAGMAQYFTGDFKAADRHLENGEKTLAGHINSSIVNSMWYVFTMLNKLRLFRLNQLEVDFETLLKDMRPLQEKIDLWVRFGPIFKPFLAFIKAEIQAASGNFEEAKKLYVDAIDIAHEQEYSLLEGFISETLGDLLFQQNNNQAEYFVSKAALLYEQCYAKANLGRIKNQYSDIFPESLEEQQNARMLKRQLDIDYLMKATSAIYQETEINDLLKIILKVLMERVGARTGYLLSMIKSKLFVQVEGIKTKDVDVTLSKKLLSEENDLSTAMVRYVQRTHKTLILENAVEIGPFINDKKTKELKLRSVLYHPIARQQELLGIVCLQNRLITSVFTEEQVEIVTKLSTHAALALENVSYRDNLEDLVLERTRELKKAQEKLITAERLAVLGRFSGSISHEIRNPLGVIGSSVYFLERKLEKSDPKILKHLNRIGNSVKQCTSIVESLRRLTQTTKQALANLNVIELCNEIIASFNVPSELEIVKEFPEEKIFVNGNWDQLRITIKNIFKNAIEAMENQGTITIRLESDHKNKLARIIITDTGPGIHPENMDRIFTPLFSTKATGIGFGLSICQQIVENHGGMLTVKSVQEKGASFIIELPL